MKLFTRLFFMSIFISNVILSSVALRGFLNGIMGNDPEGYILLFSISTFVIALYSLNKIIPKN